jgi:hypothetical protein
MRNLRCLVLCVAAVSLGACDESLSTLAGPSPNLEPTFASIQREIFESTDAAGRTSCVTCHTNVGRAPAGGLILLHDAAYDQLAASSTQKPGSARVVSGNPDGSYLIQKLEGRTSITGRRMPFNGPPYLTDGQILIIRRWIELGAPRN